METKHTQGKWEITDILEPQGTLSGSISIGVKNSGRQWIAEAKGSHINQGMTIEEFTANAKLIASSPEMLEMLKEIVHIFKRGEFDTDQNIGGRLLIKANELITKATT